MQEENTRFTSNGDIYADTIRRFDRNMGFIGVHNRENLDDLIADLLQYRDTLPTADEYMKAGLL